MAQTLTQTRRMNGMKTLIAIPWPIKSDTSVGEDAQRRPPEPHGGESETIKLGSYFPLTYFFAGAIKRPIQFIAPPLLCMTDFHPKRRKSRPHRYLGRMTTV